MTIEQYRREFAVIYNKSWIDRVFVGPKGWEFNLASITATPRLRSFTYEFFEPQWSIKHVASQEQTKQQTELEPPVVHRKRIKHHTLFG